MSKVQNEFEETIISMDTDCMDFMKKEIIEPLDELLKNIDEWFKKANIAAPQIKKNGNSEIDLTNWNANATLQTDDKHHSIEISPLKEKSLNIPEETLRSERPRRTASRAASQCINKQLNNASSKKVVQVKKEKLSTWCEEEFTIDSSLTVPTEGVNIKQEITEMPAPTRPAPKSRKPKQSSLKIKKEKIIEQEQEVKKRVTRSRKASDVIIQEVKQELIEISDSDEENVVPIPKKRTRSINEEEEISIENRNKKRSKSGSGNEEDTLAVPAEGEENTVNNTSCLKSADVTFCVKPTLNLPSTLNATVVIEKPTVIPQVPEDLMTDDESEEESRIKPVKKHQIFSAFEQSPVKKKVEAFEKLHEQATVTRVTRTKTRALVKEQNEPASNEVVTESVVKEKVKLFTPKVSKFIPKACSTQTSNRIINNSTLDSSKSASALKASQAEFRERERLRKEKEEEVLKKREALIQSQMEERRRKREEKQLKAQKQRELLEKEKQKALEAQRLKEERNNKLLAAQEEHKQKLREENEKKRLMAKMRAAEEKRKEEERRLEEQKKIKELNANLAKNHEEMMKTEKQKLIKQKTTVPIYMKVKAPLLPTDDCYDSDDEQHTDEKRYVAKWAEPSALKQQQLLMLAVGEKIKNTFFSIQAQTADLQEIFEVIAPTKLKRSSSACWQRPPRFTMLPPDLDFHQEHSDDDDYD